MVDVVIVGAGGFAREVQDIFRGHLDLNLLGFVDDGKVPGAFIQGSSVLGGLDWLFDRPDVLAVIGIGAPEVRRRVALRLESQGVRFAPPIIHSSVIMSPYVQIGEGSVICPGTILTNNIRIGKHVQLNLGTTVGHDAVMADFSTTAPGVHVNGNNCIGEGAYLGTGANFREKVSVGHWAVIGAGAAVVSDIPANTTAVGCPAKVIKTRNEGWQNE